MLVFDTGKTLMLGGAGGGGSEVAMDVDGSWMKLISFFWCNASCGQQSQRCAKSSSAGRAIRDEYPQGQITSW
jgi:hypothetical protein